MFIYVSAFIHAMDVISTVNIKLFVLVLFSDILCWHIYQNTFLFAKYRPDDIDTGNTLVS